VERGRGQEAQRASPAKSEPKQGMTKLLAQEMEIGGSGGAREEGSTGGGGGRRGGGGLKGRMRGGRRTGQ